MTETGWNEESEAVNRPLFQGQKITGAPSDDGIDGNQNANSQVLSGPSSKWTIARHHRNQL